MKEEQENNKEVSNKKTIICIIITAVLLVILGLVVGNFIKSRNNYINYNKNNSIKLQNSNQQENNITIQNQQESGGIERIPEVPNNFHVTAKPIIYLYPEEEIEVTVKVGNPQKLTHTYPKYKDGWKVKAKQNGELIDLNTGRNLYALYWEGINTVKSNMTEGFVVKGKDTIEFLEEKLEILGLNEREANEFIIYWLPKLENNKYNYIRFQTEEEINKNMSLEITPTPDTIIRVVMEFKGIENPIEIEEQKLATPKREGFILVEWGGTEIN